MVKKTYKIERIKAKETYQWLLYKHYAKRIPSISYAFGLYNKQDLKGVITFGSPPNKEYNMGKCVFENLQVNVLELNRLITDDNLEKNTLSYFVSQSLKLIPQPCCVVSYSDPNQNHYGYIYQATNWIYIGKSKPKHKYYLEDGTTFDIRRGLDKKAKVIKIEKLKRTHRYLYFLGNKANKKRMYKNLKFKILDYPKGKSSHYDCGYKTSTQAKLFL